MNTQSPVSASSLPVLRPGATVRPRVEGYTDRRGVVLERVGSVWAVLLDGDVTPTDFSARELTVLE